MKMILMISLTNPLAVNVSEFFFLWLLMNKDVHCKNPTDMTD